MATRTVHLLVGAVLLLGACSPAANTAVSSAPASSATIPPPATVPTITSTTDAPSPADGSERWNPDSVEEYRAGLEASVFLPAPLSEAPLVVMVPGGAWRTADPSGYAQLATFLAEAGAVAVTAEVGAAENGAVYPGPIEDIRCAASYGAARAREAGIEPGPVIVMGHSSGAHLASLAALGADEGMPDCPDPDAPIDALVGLAGVYDVDRLPALAVFLFGVSPEEDPAIWAEGNPLLQADLRPDLPVLLAHGTSDPLVPVSFSEDFASALTDGGHDTTVVIVEGADHGEVLLPRFTGEAILEWIRALAPPD